MENALAAAIKEKALALGYEKCGVIPVEDLAGYTEKLAERIDRYPDIRPYSEKLFGFARPREKYPWAKSIVVCVMRYGKYVLPVHLTGVIAKFYLVDSRQDESSPGYRSSVLFESFLNGLGLKTETERKFGLVPLRWAAMKAGLGVIRKNNFFYTESGSWVHLEAWLTDREMELKETCALAKCPDSCRLCISACPSGSLSAPYCMHRLSCVSCVTTWDGRDMPRDRYKSLLGGRVYGCDACQDACPNNRGKWTEEDDFPGLRALSETISLEKIVAMDYDYLRRVMSRKFWYVGEGDVWKWKVNAINAMVNSGDGSYAPAILSALGDGHEKVREMAAWAKAQLGL